MKKNNGFTLVELLAVIVILGIIMVIGGVAATKIKKDANIKEAKQIEEMLADLGPGIYSYEKNASSSDFMDMYSSNTKFKIGVGTLKNAGYLKEVTADNKIKNPAGNGGCEAYLLVEPNGVKMFKGYIDCPNLYTTSISIGTYSVFSDNLTESY